MQTSIFVVDEQPFCICEVDLRERNTDFLSGIDDAYIDYSLSVHEQSNDEQHAAMALRKELHHALETFFSLVCAYVQAPDCAYAWMSKCQNAQLYSLVKKISCGDEVFTKWKLPSIGWETIAASILQRYETGTEKQSRTVELFGTAWRRLSSEFLDTDRIDEYNSIKHGFRVSSGGFSLFVGEEKTPGEPAEVMHSMGGSEFGTAFFRVSKCDPQENRCHTSRRISLNWKIENVYSLLQLVSMSIKNVLSALKIANGQDPRTCSFHRFQDDQMFQQPWKFSSGVTSCSIDYEIPIDQIPLLNKAELLKQIEACKQRHRS